MIPISGESLVAGVIGRPVRHSLSPLIHNAWLGEAQIDGVYIALSAADEARFASLIDGLRGGSLRGLNVTIPFKETALARADRATERASLAGAANLLLFHADGSVEADNTDGEGLLGAFRVQAPKFDPRQGPVVILGAGGAARGAAAAFALAGSPEVRLVNRTRERAEVIAEALGPKVQGAKVTVFGWDQMDAALNGAAALVNATSLGLVGHDSLAIDLAALSTGAPVMDMVYRPLRTPLLLAAEAQGRPTVDGLAMLILQAAPSFEAFFGPAPPAGVDVRALALTALRERPAAPKQGARP